MTWAAKRKLIYLTIFFTIVALLVGVPTFFAYYKPPTCFDLKQNQKEDGVDCGGPCVKLCKPLELLPVVLWEQSFEVTPGVYSAVAYIQNPNLDAEAFNVPYEFKLYGERTLAAERKGTIYIPPGKSFLVFEGNFNVGQQKIRRTEFNFDQGFTWHAARKRPDLKVANINISEASSSPSINADIQNPSLTNLGRISVAAIVYGPDGNAFVASRTFLDHLDAQSVGRVVFTWPQPFQNIVAKVEIIPISE